MSVELENKINKIENDISIQYHTLENFDKLFSKLDETMTELKGMSSSVETMLKYHEQALKELKQNSDSQKEKNTGKFEVLLDEIHKSRIHNVTEISKIRSEINDKIKVNKDEFNNRLNSIEKVQWKWHGIAITIIFLITFLPKVISLLN